MPEASDKCARSSEPAQFRKDLGMAWLRRIGAIQLRINHLVFQNSGCAVLQTSRMRQLGFGKIGKSRETAHDKIGPISKTQSPSHRTNDFVCSHFWVEIAEADPMLPISTPSGNPGLIETTRASCPATRAINIIDPPDELSDLHDALGLILANQIDEIGRIVRRQRPLANFFVRQTLSLVRRDHLGEQSRVLIHRDQNLSQYV
jgi:hypothetical protein